MKLALRLPLGLGVGLSLALVAAPRARGDVLCGTESAALRTCLTARGEDFASGPCMKCLQNKHHADHDVAAGCVAAGKAARAPRGARPGEPGGEKDEDDTSADGACAPCKEPVLALNACSVAHVQGQRASVAAAEEGEAAPPVPEAAETEP